MSIDTQEISDRLSPRREVGIVAIALSVGAHLCVGLTLAALWVPPELLSSSKRREVVPTDVDLLDEPGSNELIADVAERDDEHAAQGARGTKQADEPQQAPTSAAPAPTTPPAPPTPPPPMVRPDAWEPPTRAATPAPSSSTSSATAAASGSASGSAAVSPPGEPDGGGGEKRSELPSVMARFTHDLAQWGSGVPGWETAPVGDSGAIVVTIAVGNEGKLDRRHDPFDGRAGELSQVLVESVKRTAAALVTKMGSRNLLVKFKVSAVVSDVPPPKGATLSLNFDSYDPKTKKGGSTFVLGTGRRVTFSVEVLETRALTDTP